MFVSTPYSPPLSDIYTPKQASQTIMNLLLHNYNHYPYRLLIQPDTLLLITGTVEEFDTAEDKIYIKQITR